MFANCQTGGQDIAPADVCKTPPVGQPVSYTNIANGSEAAPNVFNLFIQGGNAHNMNTIIPITHGDEPGNMGGVASGTFIAMSQHVTGVSNYIINGSPATKQTNVNLPNSRNTAGTRVSPSQSILLCLS